MNKHGSVLVLRFIMGIILALAMLFWFFSCASRLTVLSDQGEKSFFAFADDIQKLDGEQFGTRTTSILIMDQETAVVYFQPYQNEVIVEVDGGESSESFFTGSIYDVIDLASDTDFLLRFNNPERCKSEEGCLCLFRTPRYDTGSWVPGFGIVDISDLSASCQSFTTELSLNNCSIGISHGVNSYKCHNGFVIERGLAKEGTEISDAYYEAARRTAISLEKKTNYIILQG